MPTNVTDQPPHDARPTSLHPRLTVALASAADRTRLADLIAGDPVASPAGRSALVRADDLWLAADHLAQDRAAERRALRSRLDAVAARAMHECDTLRHQLEHLQTWQRTIVDGAAWAETLQGELPRHLDAVQAVRDALDERRAEQRAAQQDLERVLEQRMAAASAIEDADQELAEMSGSGMDESGLRRELEAAGQALRDSEDAHAAALAKLEELQLEATGLQVRREAAGGGPTLATPEVEAPAVTAVRDALAAIQSVVIPGEEDHHAAQLLEAWNDLHADLREVAGPEQRATEGELDAARARVAAAIAALVGVDAAASASALSAADRATLDAAHAEVLAAEEAVIGRRRVSDGARRRLEAAHAAERELLDRQGFASYLDVVLSGGRATSSDPVHAAAEREHFEATLALETLERSAATSPELRHLRSERMRLRAMIVDFLGVDPGDEVDTLLRSHHSASKDLQRALADALASVGIQPVGISLEDAAAAFLSQHPQPELPEHAPGGEPGEGRVELAAIEARRAALEGELADAQSEVERTAEALQMSQRSVDAFESELSVRASEDMDRMKRFAAAEQLRAQIDAVATALRRAEETARLQVEQCDQSVASAASAFEQAASEISDLARRARKLAEELPIDARPEGDPLRSLDELAASLRAHAEVLQPEIDRAALAVDAASGELEEATTACRLANKHGDGPRTEDLIEAMETLVLADGAPGGVRVLDEPFASVDLAARGGLLEAVRTASAHRQVVLLTEDPDVLGWAIELPADEAAAVPADAIFARVRPRLTEADEGLNPAPSEADATAPTVPDPSSAPMSDAARAAVDIKTPTTIDTDEPAPSSRRWAGQR